jgi:hypothetical protein
MGGQASCTDVFAKCQQMVPTNVIALARMFRQRVAGPLRVSGALQEGMVVCPLCYVLRVPLDVVIGLPAWGLLWVVNSSGPGD